jgi:hypothetical protein
MCSSVIIEGEIGIYRDIFGYVKPLSLQGRSLWRLLQSIKAIFNYLHPHLM